MSLRSPLGRALGLGSAKSGTAHWLAQRGSAVALVPLTVWFVISLMRLPSLDQAVLRAWLATPLSGFLACLLVLALAYHSWLGTTVIVEDYVHRTAYRVAGLLSLRFLHVVAGGAGVFAILKVAFGTIPS